MRRTLQGFGLGFFLLLSLILVIGLPAQENWLNKDIAEKIGLADDSLKEWPRPLNDIKIVDNQAVYANDDDAKVYKLYVTVLPPMHQGAVTLDELNQTHSSGSEVYVNDARDPAAEIYFEANQPGSLNTANLKANATMELRGQSQRRSPQKSYKIKLFDSTPEWSGFSVINLNKHFVSALKIENKLAFDYFELLPDIVSLRTRFVRLYVRDLSGPKPNQGFQDFGLFTSIEQPNKTFLANHSLDKKGHLYKVENFEFYRYAEAIKLKDDTTFAQDKFEQILEVRGSDDHQKLIEMLTAVNDYNQDINEVVDKHFDRDNLMTWLAANIIFDNYDSNSRNFLLYSPLNSDKWFFIPWDYDGMGFETEARSKWQKGLANYWGMQLFSRMFKDVKNVEALGTKINQLSSVINQANTRQLLDSYYGVVTENIFRPPDVNYLKIPAGQYKERYYGVIERMEKDKKYFFDSLENPMPFFLGSPALKDGQYIFTWEPSFDLQGDDLTYDFQLSKDPDFNTIVAAGKNLQSTSFKAGSLEPGEYYWKVIARDAKGNWQNSFEKFRSEDGRTKMGVKKFVLQQQPAAAGEGEQ